MWQINQIGANVVTINFRECYYIVIYISQNVW